MSYSLSELKDACVAVMQLNEMQRGKGLSFGEIVNSIDDVQSTVGAPPKRVHEVAAEMVTPGKVVYIVCQYDLRTCTLLLVDKEILRLETEDQVIVCAIPRKDGSDPMSAMRVEEEK